MNRLYKCLLVVCFLIFSSTCFATIQYTNIANTTMYSEYYPNPNAQFKGTFVFESGGMNTTKEWTKNKSFLNCVRKYGGVFLYDRSGLGKSTPDLSSSINNPITAKTVNDKLIKLLQARDIPRPYILVAHSYGGLFTGYFAGKHAQMIKGVLLIDPTPPNSIFAAKVWKTINTMQKIAQTISAKEMYSKYNYKRAKAQNTIPAALFYHMLGFNETKRQIQKLLPLPKQIPVIVLSSTYMENIDPSKPNDWYKSQKLWLNTNPNSTIMKVKSGHFIQQDHPTLVCAQLKKLVALSS